MLEVYDQSEALIITDGEVELYIDVSEFASRDDVTPAGNYEKKPDYVKKLPMRVGQTYKFKDIVPKRNMIILENKTDKNKDNYTYVRSIERWRHSPSGSIMDDGNIDGDYPFLLLFEGID